jgi:hypothetical protein
MSDLCGRGGAAEPYPVQRVSGPIVADSLCEARDQLLTAGLCPLLLTLRRPAVW